MLLVFILFIASACYGAAAKREKGAKTENYTLLFNPYPLIIGENVSIRTEVTTEVEVQEVLFVFNKEYKYSLQRSGQYWRGTVRTPHNYVPGWNLAIVYITVKKSSTGLDRIIELFKKMFARITFIDYEDHIVIEGKIWLRAEKKPEEVIIRKPLPTTEAAVIEEVVPIGPAKVLSYEDGFITGEVLYVTEEVLPLTPAATPEAYKLKITGDKSINFVSRSIEGTKEGFLPGLTREEALRLNVNGKIADDTEVEANFMSTSTVGTGLLTDREDKVSVRIRKGTDEAYDELYLGDFMAGLDETEFGRLDKYLSGAKLRGKRSWGDYIVLYSTPKGDSKYYKSYGDGTQGPYNLGDSPVFIDSEQVYVNGIKQVRGTDYEIDYQAGTVTFLTKTIINTSMIEVYYDWRETAYQHHTMGVRTEYKYSDEVDLGLTFIDDSDSLENAKEIRDSMAIPINPVGHYVVGFDGRYSGENMKVESELAYSNQNKDLLGSDIVVGKAFKINTLSNYGPIALNTRYKRVGAGFMAAADANPKQDVYEYGADVDYKPNEFYLAQVGYLYDKYKLSGTQYLMEEKRFKTKYSPLDQPSLFYNFRETYDSNDPVTASFIERLTTKHDAGSGWRCGLLDMTLQGGLETMMNRAPSEETATYKTINLGASTFGIANFSAAGNVELKDTELPAGSKPFTKTFNLNLSATPYTRYFVSLNLNRVDDSIAGVTDVTDLNYRAKPAEDLETDGKYTITSVNEDFNGTGEVVSKQTGSFRFDWRPDDPWRLRYYYKPSYTQVLRTGTHSYDNNVNQAEVYFVPVRTISTGLIYKTTDIFNVDRTDPLIRRKRDSSNNRSTSLTVKTAPLRFLSLEFNFLNEDIIYTEQTTAGASTYDRTQGNTKQYDIAARTSLSERLSIDSKYSWKRQVQGSTDASSEADSQTQTVSLKLNWNYDDRWTFSGSASYSEEFDHLLSANTYTLSPGIGVTYRVEDRLRIEGEYTYYRSYVGASTERSKYSLKSKYNMTDFIHLDLRGEHEVSFSPDYRTTEIMGSLEIRI